MVFPKSDGKEFIVTDLLTEFAGLLSEKIKLESNYAALQTEYLQVKQKLKSFKDVLYEERTFFLNEYKKSQYELHSKNMCLVEKNMDGIKNQEKYLSEVYSGNLLNLL